MYAITVGNLALINMHDMEGDAFSRSWKRGKFIMDEATRRYFNHELYFFIGTRTSFRLANSIASS